MSLLLLGSGLSMASVGLRARRQDVFQNFKGRKLK
jgi:hypothetical protein